MGVPEVQVSDLRTFNAYNAKEMPLRHMKGAAVTRRHDDLIDLFHASFGFFQTREVWHFKRPVRINDNRTDGAAFSGVDRFGGGHGGHEILGQSKSRGEIAPCVPA